MGPNPWNDCMEASKIWKTERDTQPSENMETRKQDILPNGDWPWLHGKVLSSQKFDPCARKIPWRRKWQPTLVLLPGKSHGQRILVGYSHGVAKSWTRLSDFTLLHRKNKKECSYMIKNHVYCKDPYAGVKRLALHSLFY